MLNLNYLSKFSLFLISLSISATAFSQSRHLTIELYNKQADAKQRAASPLVSRTIVNKTSEATPRTSSDITNPKEQLLVVAVDSEGNELSKTVIQNPLIKNVESFNPDTGEIEYAEILDLPQGTANVNLPESDEIEQLVIYKLKSGELVEIDRINVGKSSVQARNNLAEMSDDVFPILYNGDSDNRSDLVIVADGYTASQQAKFEQDVKRVVDGYFKEVPYNEYKKFYNVWGDRKSVV